MKPDAKWMTEVPTTIDECHAALERDDPLVTLNLWEIFDCRIELGDETLKAYTVALRAHILAFENS